MEKAKIVRELSSDGWAVLNADEPDFDLLRGETRANVLTFGFSEDSDVRGLEITALPPQPLSLRVKVGGDTLHVATQLHGAHSAYAVLAAIAVAVAVGISPSIAAKALGAVAPVPGRMQYITHPDGVRFLLDDYKASIGSLNGITDYLRHARLSSGRKFLIIGSISYGAGDPNADYVEFVGNVTPYCDQILIVGAIAEKLDATLFDRNVRFFERVKDCADYLQPLLGANDLIVVKGRNSEDHLRRIEISRQHIVNCWIMDCGRKSFCGDCPFVEEHLD